MEEVLTFILLHTDYTGPILFNFYVVSSIMTFVLLLYLSTLSSGIAQDQDMHLVGNAKNKFKKERIPLSLPEIGYHRAKYGKRQNSSQIPATQDANTVVQVVDVLGDESVSKSNDNEIVDVLGDESVSKSNISKTPTPTLCMRGNPFEEDTTITLCMDGQDVVTPEDVLMGIGALLAVYLIFNMEYPKAVNKTLLFLQSMCDIKTKEKIPIAVFRMSNFIL
ncbi:uncharacterized protein LOC143102957 [Alosa pseudoharengus]|uniref:uncharacterized protein LOC143102957 n=1 Tax=Alosa pseudoharengus TaxID=34774 RepID=UPI003F8B951E